MVVVEKKLSKKRGHVAHRLSSLHKSVIIVRSRSIAVCDLTTPNKKGKSNYRSRPVFNAILRASWFHICIYKNTKSTMHHLRFFGWHAYHLSAVPEMWASCELCPLWCCSSPHRCSCPHLRVPPLRCTGCPSPATQIVDCLAGQSMDTHWKPTRKSGLEQG